MNRIKAEETALKIIESFVNEIHVFPNSTIRVEFIATHNRIFALGENPEEINNVLNEDTAVELVKNLRELRTRMYDPIDGAWLSCSIVLNPVNDVRKFAMAFNYNEIPRNSVGEPLPIVELMKDFETYPRVHEPDWLILEKIYHSS